MTLQTKNYQKELDKIITGECAKRIPRLILHACCAPCSSYVLEYLSQYFDITLYFYNPNITEKEEYYKRFNELKKLIEIMPLKRKVKLIDGGYEDELFFKSTIGLENEPERGARCNVCFRLRLEKTAKLAKELNADYFCTTLTISPHKNAALINSIGEELFKKYDVKFLPSDFKKNEGFKRSTELCRIYGLYRQNYCGCIYSKIKNKNI